MTSTTIYDAGQVVVVEVPFSDHSGSKRRPAVVVSTEAFHGALLDVIVCPISSQPRYHRKPGTGDHPLDRWKEAGLHHPSTVRASKILAIGKQVIRRTLGALASEDLAQVRKVLQAAFGLEEAPPPEAAANDTSADIPGPEPA